MNSVGIRQLKRDTSAIIRQVREHGETINVTHPGNVVAQIVPVITDEDRQARVRQVWERMDRLSEQIAAKILQHPRLKLIRSETQSQTDALASYVVDAIV